ncbi:MAG: glycerol-3-phosphate acyltransferase, partial [Anaerolineae bacterium]
AIAIGYFCGAIPIGYLMGLLKGIDIRQYGSGRTGGTNVLRTVGPLAAVATVIGDIAKGAVAVLLVRWLFHSASVEALAALFSVLGHQKSLFIGLQGGAGTMTSSGAMLALWPLAALVAGPIPIVSLALTRYASVGSLTGAVLGSLVVMGLVIVARQPIQYSFYALGAGALIVYAHRPNIRRLLAGTERRIGEQARELVGKRHEG